MTDAGVLQGGLPVQFLAALVELEARVVGVIDGLVHLHVDSSEGVDHLGQAVEVDDDEVIDTDVRHLLHGLEGAGGSRGNGLLVAAAAGSVGEGGVELAVLLGTGAVAVESLARGDVHQGVAGDGYCVNALAVCGDVHDQCRVGAGHGYLVVTL